MIRIQKIRLGGITSLDIRRCKEIGGEIVPTKSGISLSPSILDEIMEAVKNSTVTAVYVEER